MHPGDILTASNGKTIEVNNTDAEGRLTLADALVFAEKLDVEAIVDLATLTGACIVALGDDIGGLWSPNQELADQLKTAAEKAGEKFWQMPMEDKYFEGLKSPIADMKNTGPGPVVPLRRPCFYRNLSKKPPGPIWILPGRFGRINRMGYTMPELRAIQCEPWCNGYWDWQNSPSVGHVIYEQ